MPHCNSVLPLTPDPQRERVQDGCPRQAVPLRPASEERSVILGRDDERDAALGGDAAVGRAVALDAVIPPDQEAVSRPGDADWRVATGCGAC